MSSSRPKLTLDEQSFQGLLAAAFTIQEHNDRQRKSRQFAAVERDDGHPASQLPTICRDCGSPLQSEESPCAICSQEKFRPGERLQRNWASMWMMSQEKGLWNEPRDNAAPDVPPSPDARSNGRSRGHSSIAVPSPIAEPMNGTRKPPRGAQDDIVIPASPSDEPFDDDLSGNSVYPGVPFEKTASEAQAEIEWPNELAYPATTTASTERGIDQYDLAASAKDFSADTDLAVPVNEVPETILRHGLSDLQVKLRFRRADFYLGLSIVVALLALLWPSASPQRPQLHTWQRMLIAIGIAEAPAAPVAHFHGDPNLKVWVDTHTALYYCPGDELYGKSPDGHYTTQHDAQSDRFEPAERSVCTE